MSRQSKSTLLSERRGALLRRGFTLRRFCDRFGFSYDSARAALSGNRHGPIARSIVAKAKEVSRG